MEYTHLKVSSLILPDVKFGWLVWLSSNKTALDAKVDVEAHISEMTHIPTTLRLSTKM